MQIVLYTKVIYFKFGNENGLMHNLAIVTGFIVTEGLSTVSHSQGRQKQNTCYKIMVTGKNNTYDNVRMHAYMHMLYIYLYL